jgi:hypothetical protein
MTLRIFEASDYILAVSDKSTLSNNGDYYLGYVNNILHRWNMTGIHKGKSVWINKVKAYRPKNNAPELDLPLLPEMAVEDDVEKLYLKKLEKEDIQKRGFRGANVGSNPRTHKDRMYQLEGFKDGLKTATKFYSEEDLITFGWLCREKSLTNVELLAEHFKQPKILKWFVAEMEYIHDDFVTYPETKGEKPKTTTIGGKTYLVGKYI